MRLAFFVLFSVFLLKAKPVTLSLRVIIFDGHSDHCAHPCKREKQCGEQRAVPFLHDSVRWDALKELAHFIVGKDRRFSFRNDMLWSSNRMGRIGRHNLSGHQPVEEHADARGRPDIRRRVCGGRSTYRVTATYVRGPKPDERPGDRRRSNSAPGCGSTFAVVHGTPAGRTRESKKNFCCVTTRRRIFGVLRCLGRGAGTLAAHPLRLGLPRFSGGIQATAGLLLRRLSAAYLQLTGQLLAVTLVPTPWLVLPSAALAQADPRTWSSHSGTARGLWFIVVAAHGSAISQGTAREERATVLPGRLSKTGN